LAGDVFGMESKELLAELEYALNTKLRPTFLTITDPNLDENGDIQILISCIAFKGKSIQERVSIVFNVIKQFIPKLIEDRLVVIQCYDSTEIEEVLDNILDDELWP
jgi:stress-induced morphogen